MFRRKQEAAAQPKFDIQAAIAAALALPVRNLGEGSFDDVANRDPANIARNAKIWAQRNHAALNYTGDSSQEISAKLDALRDKRRVHAEEVATCKVDAIKQVGGLEGRHAYMQAGVAAPVDSALLAKQKAAETEVRRIDAEVTELRSQQVKARDHERVSNDLVGMLAALLGGLQ